MGGHLTQLAQRLQQLDGHEPAEGQSHQGRCQHDQEEGTDEAALEQFLGIHGEPVIAFHQGIRPYHITFYPALEGMVVEGNALFPPADAASAFRNLLEGGSADFVGLLSFCHVEGLPIPFQQHPQSLVLQVIAYQQEGTGFVRIIMVRPDPEPGQFELDGQGGAAFWPDKG